MEKDRKYDKRFSEFQLAELNQAFKANPYMRGKQLRVLAARLKLSENFTLSWFLRRRAKLRKKFLEGNIVTMDKTKIHSTNILLTLVETSSNAYS